LAPIAQLDPFDEAAKILITAAILGEQGVAASLRGGDLRTNQSKNAGLFFAMWKRGAA
jgi:hypothetical protein